MFKSINEFIKIFSFLFLLSGIFFFTQQMYLIGSINIASFLIIKILDSDWSFDTFKFSNHHLIVTITTFVLIFINVFFLMQEMKYASLFIKTDEETQKEYINYEKNIYESIQPCINAHNNIIDTIESKKAIKTSDIKTSQNTCFETITSIQDVPIPESLPMEIKKLCDKNKTEMKKIVASLGDFDYAKRNNPEVQEKIKETATTVAKITDKIRTVLQIPTEELQPSNELIYLSL